MRLPLVLLALPGVLIGCQAQPSESIIEQDSVVVTPGTFDFGTLQIGMTSGPHSVTVAPGPLNQSDTVRTVSASCPDFLISAAGLPADVYRVCEPITCADGNCPAPNSIPGGNSVTVVCQTTDIQTYLFDTAFRPTVAGQVSCVVTVTEFDNRTMTVNNKSITLTGTGQAPPYRIDVQPTSVAFGDVRRNADSTQAQIAVRSAGASPLSVSSVAISAGFAIKSGPTGSYQLPPNATQTYPIVCHPTAVGAMTGKLTIDSNDPVQPQVSVPLSCNGIDSSLDITPSPVALPTTRVGEPVDATIALSNTGAAPMTLKDVSLSGTGITMTSGPPQGMMLGPSASTNVAVHFAATEGGDSGATLVVSYDGQARSARITARALATSMALTPDGEVDFGPVCIGKRKTQSFTLIANDLGAFKLASISDPGPPFMLSAPTLPLSVLGSGATQVQFQISAAPSGPGVATAEVVVRTDIPGRSDHPLQLSVLGVPAGVAATPDMIDLGSNPVNTTTLGQEVHLSNCGTAALGFSNARIEGGDALDFAIVQQPSSSMIEPAGMASWLIVLQAHKVGVKQSTFKVDYDGGTASVALQGEGLGDLGRGTGRGSYYACAAGRPAALWPVAIALLVLRRRRARASA